MSEIAFSLNPQTEAEYETAFATLFDEIRRMNEQIRQDQNEIDRLRAEASPYKLQSQQLKSEGERISADIRVRLNGVHAALDRMAGVL